MNFSIAYIIPSLIFSSIGLFVFNRGRKDPNLSWVVIGLLLMTYSFVVTSAVLCWAVGLGLVYLAHLKK